MRISKLSSVLFAATWTSAAFGVNITLNNPGFETAATQTEPVPSWTVSGGGYQGQYTPLEVSYPAGIPEGNQIAYLINTYASISQSTGAILSAGRIYNFTVSLGDRGNAGDFQGRTWVSLLPSSQAAAFVANPVTSDYLAIKQVEPEDVPDGTFQPFTVTFDTTSPANATLMSQYAGQNLVVAVTVVQNGETDVDAASFSYIPSGPTHWNVNGSGDWNDDAKWSEGAPNGIDQPANFLGVISAPQTVYTNTAVTVGAATFDNVNSYQVTGQGSLTLQVTSGNASVNVVQGSHKLNLPTFFASDTTLTVAGGATLTLSDPVVIRANKTVTRNGNVVIEAPLSIETGGVYNVGGGPAAVVFGAPSLASGAKVNVGNNALVVDYRGQASPAATIKAQLISGRNNGAWNGEGISTAAATASTGLGWVDSPGTQSVLVKYTYNGDANLDGTVNSIDFGALVAAYGATSGAIWAQGDFDYDGKINTKDFNALAGNFGLTIPAPAGLGSVVPEPASAAVVGMIGLCSFVRRARRIAR